MPLNFVSYATNKEITLMHDKELKEKARREKSVF